MTVRREVAKSAILSVAAITAVSVGGFWAARSAAAQEAVRQAEAATELLAAATISPVLDEGLLRGKSRSIDRLDQAVQSTVLSDRILTVRVWSESGEILYSDDLSNIGDRFPLGDDIRQVLETGQPHAELSDLAKPENADQADFEQLLEVYVLVRSPGGRRMLFETYQSTAGLDDAGRRILGAFAPMVVAVLFLLGLIQVLLSYRLARTLERAQRESEDLLRQALTASDIERRTIAADLHDGVVQDLVGLTFALEAMAGGTPEPSPETLTGAATTSRRSVRSLRSLLVEIYPPNLDEVGLAGALTDLADTVDSGSMCVTAQVDPHVELTSDRRAAVYRVAREALSNARKHSRASTVEIRLDRENGTTVLTVSDNGVGFDPACVPPGHMGQRMMRNVCDSIGARFSIHTQPGQGAVVKMELPA